MNNRERTKRVLAVLLSLCMAVSMIPISRLIAFAADAPTTISTVAELEAFRDAVNGGDTYEGKTVTLTADLDLGSVTSWTPIGNSSRAFKGTFDGGNHVIYNLTINTSNRYCGLFGRLQNATVKNLGLENVTVVSTNNDAAGLAGNAQGGIIERCYVTGSVQGRGAVSGILGSTHSSTYTTTIRNCYARVALKNTGSTKDIAGISGWNEATSVKIENCYAACIGEIRPIAGWSDGSAVSNSQFVSTYFDKTLSPDFSTSSGRTDLGRASAELKTQSTFSGWNFNSVWAIEPGKNGGYPYLRGFAPGLGGAPGSVTVTVTDEDGNPLDDVAVTIRLAGTDTSTDISLGLQGDGVYSCIVDTVNETYDIYVNGEKTDSVKQVGSAAVATVVKVSIQEEKTFTVTYQTNTGFVLGTIKYGVTENNAFPTASEFGVCFPEALAKLRETGNVYVRNPIWYADADFRTAAVMPVSPANGQNVTAYCGLSTNTGISDVATADYTYGGDGNGGYKAGSSYSVNWYSYRNTCRFNFIYEKKAGDEWILLDDSYKTDLNGTEWDNMITLKTVADSGYYRLKYIECTAVDKEGNALFKDYAYPDASEADGRLVTVKPRTLTISGVTAADRAYNGKNTVALTGGTLTGIINNDTVDFTLGSGTMSDANTGKGKAVAANITLTGKDAGNYTLTQPADITVNISNAEQTAPVGLSAVNETVSGKADGKIAGLDAAMEYRREGETIYTGVAGNEVSSLAAGKYYVRYAQKANYDASADTEIVIGVGRKLNVTLPEAQIGYTLTTGATQLDWHGSAALFFTLADGYSCTDAFAVKVNGTTLEPEADGKYVIVNAETDMKVTVEGVADITPPTAAITIKSNVWREFLNNVTFGLFFKDTANVMITAADADTGSGVAKVEYLLSERRFETEEAITGAWTALKADNGEYKFSIRPGRKAYVYVRVTDQAGNITVINSQGVVVYIDAVQDTRSITFTRLSQTNVAFKVTLNGNTVSAVYLNNDKIAGNNYTASQDGTIELKAAYLQTLAAGAYKLRIEYNPLGENFVAGPDNEAPAVTTVQLTVNKVNGTASITNDPGKTYDGTRVHTEHSTNNTAGKVIAEYKKRGADDAAYVAEAPKNVGDYTVRVTVLADAAGNYTEAVSAPVDFTITKRDITIDVSVGDKQYDGLNTAVIVSAELVGVIAGDTVSLINGTPSFTSAAVGNDIAISFTDFAISGSDAANYNLIQPKATANIYNIYTAKQDIDYTVNNNDWINTDFEVTAKDGFQLSVTDAADGTWSDRLIAVDETAAGELKFYVRNKATGAISQQAAERYRIDKTPAAGQVSISGAETVWDKILEIITFGLYFNDRQRISVTADDNLSGIAGIEYYEADKSLTREEVETLGDDVWTKMDGSTDVSMEDAKQFVYYIRLTDVAGNVSYIATDGAEYDITAPAVSDIHNDAIYYTTQSVTVTDKNLKSVTVNGVEVEELAAAILLEGNKDTTYEIVAVDKAGNVTTVRIIMKPISNLGKPIDDLTPSNVKPEDKDTIEDVRKQLEEIDTTAATSEEKAEIQKQIDKCRELLKKIDEINKQISSPKTGDSGNTQLWFLLAVLSLAGVVAAITNGQKRRLR